MQWYFAVHFFIGLRNFTFLRNFETTLVGLIDFSIIKHKNFIKWFISLGCFKFKINNDIDDRKLPL